MVTVHREAGFRFVIYVDDHEPAHVHVIGAGEAKVNLMPRDDEPAIVYAIGMKRADLRRVARIVTRRSAELMADWTGIHGVPGDK